MHSFSGISSIILIMNWSCANFSCMVDGDVGYNFGKGSRSIPLKFSSHLFSILDKMPLKLISSWIFDWRQTFSSMGCRLVEYYRRAFQQGLDPVFPNFVCFMYFKTGFLMLVYLDKKLNRKINCGLSRCY